MSLIHIYFYSKEVIMFAYTNELCLRLTAVSYTHLDVYKRQMLALDLRSLDVYSVNEIFFYKIIRQ